MSNLYGDWIIRGCDSTFEAAGSWKDVWAAAKEDGWRCFQNDDGEWENRCQPKDNGALAACIGLVKWHGPIFEQDCLRDIADFCASEEGHLDEDDDEPEEAPVCRRVAKRRIR